MVPRLVSDSLTDIACLAREKSTSQRRWLLPSFPCFQVRASCAKGSAHWIDSLFLLRLVTISVVSFCNNRPQEISRPISSSRLTLFPSLHTHSGHRNIQTCLIPMVSERVRATCLPKSSGSMDLFTFPNTS